MAKRYSSLVLGLDADYDEEQLRELCNYLKLLRVVTSVHLGNEADVCTQLNRARLAFAVRQKLKDAIDEAFKEQVI